MASWQKLIEGDLSAHNNGKNATKDGATVICDWTNTPTSDKNGTMTENRPAWLPAVVCYESLDLIGVDRF